MIAWSPLPIICEQPNTRATMHASCDTRELRSPCPPPPFLRAMTHASYNARELRLTGPPPNMQAMIHASLDYLVRPPVNRGGPFQSFYPRRGSLYPKARLPISEAREKHGARSARRNAKTPLRALSGARKARETLKSAAYVLMGGAEGRLEHHK